MFCEYITAVSSKLWCFDALCQGATCGCCMHKVAVSEGRGVIDLYISCAPAERRARLYVVFSFFSSRNQHWTAV